MSTQLCVSPGGSCWIAGPSPKFGTVALAQIDPTGRLVRTKLLAPQGYQLAVLGINSDSSGNVVLALEEAKNIVFGTGWLYLYRGDESGDTLYANAYTTVVPRGYSTGSQGGPVQFDRAGNTYVTGFLRDGQTGYLSSAYFVELGVATGKPVYYRVVPFSNLGYGTVPYYFSSDVLGDGSFILATGHDPGNNSGTSTFVESFGPAPYRPVLWTSSPISGSFAQMWSSSSDRCFYEILDTSGNRTPPVGMIANGKLAWQQNPPSSLGDSLLGCAADYSGGLFVEGGFVNSTPNSLIVQHWTVSGSVDFQQFYTGAASQDSFQQWAIYPDAAYLNTLLPPGTVAGTACFRQGVLFDSLAVPSRVVSGGSFSVRVMANGPAPASGIAVVLTTDNSNLTFSNGTTKIVLAIPPGEISAVTSCTCTASNFAIPFDITAEGSKVLRTARVWELPPTIESATVNTSVVAGGQPIPITVVLNGMAGAPGLKISISSSDVTAVPNRVITIPEGDSAFSSSIPSNIISGSARTVTLTFKDPSGNTKTATVEIT